MNGGSARIGRDALVQLVALSGAAAITAMLAAGLGWWVATTSDPARFRCGEELPERVSYQLEGCVPLIERSVVETRTRSANSPAVAVFIPLAAPDGSFTAVLRTENQALMDAADSADPSPQAIEQARAFLARGTYVVHAQSPFGSDSRAEPREVAEHYGLSTSQLEFVSDSPSVGAWWVIVGLLVVVTLIALVATLFVLKKARAQAEARAERQAKVDAFEEQMERAQRLFERGAYEKAAREYREAYDAATEIAAPGPKAATALVEAGLALQAAGDEEAGEEELRAAWDILEGLQATAEVAELLARIDEALEGEGDEDDDQEAAPAEDGP